MSGLELSRRTTMRWMMAAAGLLAMPLRAEAAAAASAPIPISSIPRRRPGR